MTIALFWWPVEKARAMVIRSGGKRARLNAGRNEPSSDIGYEHLLDRLERSGVSQPVPGLHPLTRFSICTGQRPGISDKPAALRDEIRALDRGGHERAIRLGRHHDPHMHSRNNGRTRQASD